MEVIFMKMNKKVIGLIMSAMLTVPFVVGCNDNNVTEELPQTQIEEQPNEQQEQPKFDEEELKHFNTKVVRSMPYSLLK